MWRKPEVGRVQGHLGGYGGLGARSQAGDSSRLKWTVNVTYSRNILEIMLPRTSNTVFPPRPYRQHDAFLTVVIFEYGRRILISLLFNIWPICFYAFSSINLLADHVNY